MPRFTCTLGFSGTTDPSIAAVIMRAYRDPFHLDASPHDATQAVTFSGGHLV